MTPKEKAAELVIKFYQPLPASKLAEKGKEHLYYNQYNAAKQSAIIAVDEIMLICPYLSKENTDTLEQLRASDEYFTSYWQQVKTEIEKS